jgi:hypothetical protein
MQSCSASSLCMPWHGVVCKGIHAYGGGGLCTRRPSGTSRRRSARRTRSSHHFQRVHRQPSGLRCKGRSPHAGFASMGATERQRCRTEPRGLSDAWRPSTLALPQRPERRSWTEIRANPNPQPSALDLNPRTSNQYCQQGASSHVREILTRLGEGSLSWVPKSLSCQPSPKSAGPPPGAKYPMPS